MMVTRLAPVATRLGRPLGLKPTRILPCRARPWSKQKNDKEVKNVVDAGVSTQLDEKEVDEYSAPPTYPMYQAPPPVAERQYVTQQQPVPVAPPPPAPQVVSSGPPFYVWVLLGAALAWVVGKIQEFRRNPMAFVAKLMSSQGGATPGPGPGGMDMAAIMQQMQQMQASQSMSGAPGAGGFGAPMNMPPKVDAAAAAMRDGAVFEQKRRGGASEPERGPTVLDIPASDVSESSRGPSTSGGAVPSKNFFADSDRSTASESTSSAGRATSSFFADKQGASSAEGNTANSGGPGGADSMNEELFDRLLEMIENNPEMRAQMESHLPEAMRGSDIWSWVRNNPAMKQQLMSQMGPLMSQGFGSMDPDMSRKAFQQAKDAGLDPNIVMAEMAKDPEIMQLMQKPNVSAALLQMQSQPDKAWEHMSDPDVTKMMMKLTEIQSKHGFMPGVPPGGMPGQGQHGLAGAAGSVPSDEFRMPATGSTPVGMPRQGLEGGAGGAAAESTTSGGSGQAQEQAQAPDTRTKT